MSDKSWVWRIRYCGHHQMVYHPKSRRWKTVPSDFIPELLHADLPVDVIGKQCPRCPKADSNGLNTA
jgi:hypothetical protein